MLGCLLPVTKLQLLQITRIFQNWLSFRALREHSRLGSQFSLCSVVPVCCSWLSRICQVFSYFLLTCREHNRRRYFLAIKMCCGFMTFHSPFLHIPYWGIYLQSFMDYLTFQDVVRFLGQVLKPVLCALSCLISKSLPLSSEIEVYVPLTLAVHQRGFEMRFCYGW